MEKILVFGPVQPPQVACGVSSAVRAFAGSRVRDRYDIELVSTFRQPRERALFERLAYGVWLAAKTALRMMRSGAVLADIHAVSDRSLWSHAAVMFGARMAGRPALLRIHGGDFHQVFERAGGVQRQLIRFILRSATRLIVLSEGWRHRIATIEPRAAVDVIPNMVDCGAFDRLASRPPRQCRRILFLANFCERKGHFDALRAIAKLAPEFPDAVLVLAGDDRDPGTRDLLEREAERLGIRDRIEFVGTVSGEAKDQEIRDADILILPSHTENMPISLIEGMAAALPVVATAVGAIPEMIRDGETGFVIEARDADALAERLARLFRDPALGRRIGQQAQAYARATWDTEVVAGRTLALYEQLVAGKGAHAA
ncbi:MAG: glycosyltransferase family 4 protein [Nitrosomonadales bacterium]|nr:glycosyltransferase family 4 protein [Nitrosomonadales bacterium]